MEGRPMIEVYFVGGPDDGLVCVHEVRVDGAPYEALLRIMNGLRNPGALYALRHGIPKCGGGTLWVYDYQGPTPPTIPA
jgi:hypothetical protein